MGSQYPFHYFQFDIILSRAAEMTKNFLEKMLMQNNNNVGEEKFTKNYVQTPMKRFGNCYSGLYNSDPAFLRMSFTIDKHFFPPCTFSPGFRLPFTPTWTCLIKAKKVRKVVEQSYLQLGNTISNSSKTL